MPYPLKEKLVIAVTSSALFDMSEEDEYFRINGISAYKALQRERLYEPLGMGTAFHFLEKLLKINKSGLGDLVEVILLSRNDPYSGYRILNSVENYSLDITRSLFTTGRSPLEYIQPLSVDLFLSANIADVRQAVNAGYPAGLALPGKEIIPFEDDEIRIAFDFDGVIADDESEKIFHQTKDLNKFHEYEAEMAQLPHNRGPLAGFLRAISKIRTMEEAAQAENPSFRRKIRISIVTARNSPSHHRVFTTLDSWGVEIDDLMLLGGINKADVLRVLRPHIFFDDQMLHLKDESDHIPSIHIPYGVKNLT